MTRARKSPAMPLYGKDAYSDEKFTASPWDVQGIFWRLAFWQWMEGSIPDDLDTVVAIVGKPRETKRLWAVLLKTGFFVPKPNEPGRLYNQTTDGHREEMLDKRGRNQDGADITNAKRTGGRAGERTAKRTENGALHAATANTDSPIPIPETGGEGEGEGRTLTPQQAAVKRVEDTLEEHTTDFLLPGAGRVMKAVKVFGLDFIVTAIAEEGAKSNLDGRNWSYLHQILESRKRRPHGVTSGNRQPGTDNGNGNGTDRRSTQAEPGTGSPIGRPELGRFKPRRAD